MSAAALLLRLEAWDAPEGEEFAPVCARAVKHMLANEDARSALRMCYETGPLAFALRPGINLFVDAVEAGLRTGRTARR